MVGGIEAATEMLESLTGAVTEKRPTLSIKVSSGVTTVSYQQYGERLNELVHFFISVRAIDKAAEAQRVYTKYVVDKFSLPNNKVTDA